MAKALANVVGYAVRQVCSFINPCAKHRMSAAISAGADSGVYTCGGPHGVNIWMWPWTELHWTPARNCRGEMLPPLCFASCNQMPLALLLMPAQPAQPAHAADDKTAYHEASYEPSRKTCILQATTEKCPFEPDN